MGNVRVAVRDVIAQLNGWNEMQKVTYVVMTPERVSLDGSD